MLVGNKLTGNVVMGGKGMIGEAAMKKIILLYVLLCALIFVTACSPAASLAPEMEQAAPFEAPAFGKSVDSAGNVFRQAESEVSPGSSQAQAERLVIKNASLSIIVDDPVKVMDSITQLADELGGFVVSANLSETFLDSGVKVPSANITIRVPAELFNDALRRIKAETTELPQYENINSQDVTSEYTDLASRLRNLESAEAKLNEIMDEAIRTEDVLSVYNQLVQVREQIELIKGQMKYYEESAAMSAISVELVANEAVQPLTIGGWQPVGTAKDAIQALINTLKVLGNFVIWAVLFLLPVLGVLYIIFVLPLSLLWRAWRRRRAKIKPPATPPSKPTE